MKLNIGLFLATYASSIFADEHHHCVQRPPSSDPSDVTYIGIENDQYEHTITVGSDAKWTRKKIATGGEIYLFVEHPYLQFHDL